MVAIEMRRHNSGFCITKHLICHRSLQAFRLGRYPIHYHLNGNVTGSYVRGCAIHRTYNRAVTIHAVDYLLGKSRREGEHWVVGNDITGPGNYDELAFL